MKAEKKFEELSLKSKKKRLKEDEARLDRLRIVVDKTPELGPGWAMAAKSLAAEVDKMKKHMAEIENGSSGKDS